MKTRLFIAATALAAVSGAAAAAPASTFLPGAIKGDTSEMMLGMLAAKQGGSPQVRQFGQMLQTDHGKAKTEAIAAARREHVMVPTGPKPDAKMEYAKLQKLSGSAFDREFKTAMIADHQKDIATYMDQAKTGDATTAALARKTLPTLRKHLAAAQRLPG